MPDIIRELNDIKKVLVKGIARELTSYDTVAELAKAYARIDAQIVARKEKGMEWDE